MPLTVATVQKTKNGELTQAVRISNDVDDTIDLDVATQRDAFSLAGAVNCFAENLTVLEQTENA